MNKEKKKQLNKFRRKGRIRAKVAGVAKCPRLSVFRSNKGMYLQLINDDKGVTLASAYSKEVKKKNKKVAISFELGRLIAEKAQKLKIKKVIFDRGGCKYHGRIKAAADGAREAGLEF